MYTKKGFIISLLFISFLQAVNSQIFQENYKTRDDSIFTSGDVFLSLPLASWFYNNEYFNPFYKGYTLIGANAQPRIIYQSNSVLKFSAGIYLHRYYGDSQETEVKPLLNIEYRPRKNFSVLMGSFDGGENHGLNEVMFSFENHLKDISENGILIRYSGKLMDSESWLNWESFIMPGDTFQEKFTAGSMNNFKLASGSSWQLTLPVAILAHHSGGQINNNNDHIESLFNLTEGIQISHDLSGKSPANIFGEITIFHSLGDFIPSQGRAFSIKSGIQLPHFELNAAYFRGVDFISFSGNPLFRSWQAGGDPVTPNKYGGTWEMLNFKAGFKQKIGNNSFLFLRFEGYYYTESSQFDYSYSLHLQVNDFIKFGKK